MKTLNLTRLLSDSHKTQGVLIYDRQVLCHTLELPWLGNLVNVSCIPDGSYDCYKINHSRLGNVIGLKNVPSRSGILIHAGNTVKDIRGCILVGLDAHDTGVSSSRIALDRLLSRLPSTFKLDIRKV